MTTPALKVQTPGEPVKEDATTNTGPATPEPTYSAKHNGGPRWRIWSTETDDWFSDFVVAGEGAKALAEDEAARLNAGGEPFVEPPKQEPQAPATQVQAPATKRASGEADATTIKQPVLTSEGWLCPAPKAKE